MWSAWIPCRTSGGHSTKGGPTVIVAKTVKGKGVSFMENVAGFHGKPPSKEQLDQALRELEAE